MSNVTCCVGMPVSEECSVAKATAAEATSTDRMELCPFAAHGHCPYAEDCSYVHGDVCDLCHCAVLSPFDLEQRQQHTEVTVQLITTVTILRRLYCTVLPTMCIVHLLEYWVKISRPKIAVAFLSDCMNLVQPSLRHRHITDLLL